jgi:hypothetical protein
LESRRACDKLYKLAFDAIDRKEKVYLTIKKNIEKLRTERLASLEAERSEVPLVRD